MKVVYIGDDGTERDITEHTKMLYDAVRGSMDWGSGMLATDEMLRAAQVGTLFGKVTVEDVAQVCDIESRFPEPYPPRPADYGRGNDYNIPGGTWMTYESEGRAWGKRRDAWVAEEARRLFGDPPTWESIDKQLKQVESLMDDVTGFDE